ncbi:MAG TPA: DUF2846 domain-containing protein [Stellaceae bacterium]|jgi:hypothetical protein|nr:DUF2846 domain-containing protein [Stellaceae bacterium]
MARSLPSGSRHWTRWAGALMLMAAGCAAPPPAAELPVPPGQARIWLYRAWEPSESLNLASVEVNGGYFGSVANGSAVYRDVPPGHYHIAPASFVPSWNQDRNVDLAPGQQLYVKIVSLVSWGSDNTAAKNIQRDAFYAWIIPPQIAQGEIAAGRSGI